MQRSNIIEPMSPAQHRHYVSWLATTIKSCIALIIILACITLYQLWQWYTVRTQLHILHNQYSTDMYQMQECTDLEKRIQDINTKQHKLNRIKETVSTPLTLIQEITTYCSDMIQLHAFELKEKEIMLRFGSTSMNMLLRMIEQLQHSPTFNQVTITSLKYIDEHCIEACVQGIVKTR